MKPFDRLRGYIYPISASAFEIKARCRLNRFGAFYKKRHSFAGTKSAAIYVLINCFISGNCFAADSAAIAQKSNTSTEEAVRIGSPMPKTLDDRYSNIANPDAIDVKKSHDRYQISCAPTRAGLGHFFADSNRRPGQQLKSSSPMTLFWSLAVVYFLTKGESQYIYGTLVDERGFSNGKPVFVLAEEWNCSLSDGLKLR